MHSVFLPSKEWSRVDGRGTALRPAVVQAPKPRVEPVPRAQWPLWAKALARSRFHHAEDIGMGDTIVHLIGNTRSDRFKKWFERKFGRSCGCSDRQQWLNRLFPY